MVAQLLTKTLHMWLQTYQIYSQIWTIFGSWMKTSHLTMVRKSLSHFNTLMARNVKSYAKDHHHLDVMPWHNVFMVSCFKYIQPFGLELKLLCAWPFFAMHTAHCIRRTMRPEKHSQWEGTKKEKSEIPPNRLAEIGQPGDIPAKESSWTRHRLVLKLVSSWDSQQDGWTAGMRTVDVCQCGPPLSHWHWLTDSLQSW